MRYLIFVFVTSCLVSSPALADEALCTDPQAIKAAFDYEEVAGQLRVTQILNEKLFKNIVAGDQWIELNGVKLKRMADLAKAFAATKDGHQRFKFRHDRQIKGVMVPCYFKIHEK